MGHACISESKLQKRGAVGKRGQATKGPKDHGLEFNLNKMKNNIKKV